jgi:hypothetical protein
VSQQPHEPVARYFKGRPQRCAAAGAFPSRGPGPVGHQLIQRNLHVSLLMSRRKLKHYVPMQTRGVAARGPPEHMCRWLSKTHLESNFGDGDTACAVSYHRFRQDCTIAVQLLLLLRLCRIMSTNIYHNPVSKSNVSPAPDGAPGTPIPPDRARQWQLAALAPA